MPDNLTSNFRALTSFAAFFIACALAFMPAAASAEKADRDKPVTIEADKLLHDELKQISVFSGRAVLSKGSMVLRGDRIELRQDPDGYQFGVILPEDKKRAFFRQKREGVDEYIEGEALRIDYDGRADRIVLSEQAEIRRYRGATLGDQMSGKHIVYDNLSDVFTIDGQRGSDKTKSNDTRVRATLAPRSKTLDAPNDKPTAAPTTNNKK
jgi:lipopolysaccharide export system protein LptA